MKKGILVVLSLFILTTISGCGLFSNTELRDLKAKVEAIEKEVTVLKAALEAKEKENASLRAEIDSLNTVIAQKDEALRLAKVPVPPAPPKDIDYTKVRKTEVVINFGFDRTDITPEAKLELAKVVDFLQNNKSTLFIQGFADPQGDLDYNIALSLRRAKSARETILKMIGTGQKPCDIVSVGRGIIKSDGNISNKEKRKVIITAVEDCSGRPTPARK
jgi:outer membrane protein OmpA-like peptidoglycan-associated protein